MNPSHRIRTPRFLSAVFAIAGLAALATAVGFAKAIPSAQAGYQNTGPATVKISQSAQFISQFQINVVVTLSCTAGSGYFVGVSVEQPQGFGTTRTGNGTVNGQCTGKQQKLAVAVYTFFDGWQLGNAVASAEACADSCAADTKQIHITP